LRLFETLLSLAAHHGEADPELMAWIKNLLDDIIGLGPWPVVIALGVIILGLPAAVVGVYLVQQRGGHFLPPNYSQSGEAVPTFGGETQNPNGAESNDRNSKDLT
jgi:hypothetical protein